MLLVKNNEVFKLDIMAYLLLFLTVSPFIKGVHYLLISSALLIYSRKNIHKNKTTFFLLQFFIIFILGHYLVKSLIFPLEKPNVKYLLIENLILLKFLIAYLLSLNIKNIDVFNNRLEKAIYRITLISLFFTILQFTNINLLLKIPFFEIDRFYTLGIHNFIKSEATIFYSRNVGIAWEPGAFQFILNIGFFLNNLRNKKLFDLKKIIYIYAIFTTKSTTGLIILGIQIIYLLYKSLKISREKIKKIYAVIFIIFLAIFYLNTKNNIINNEVIKKIDLKNKHLSTLGRKEHLEMDLKSFSKNIFLGRGVVLYSQDRNNEISSNSHTRILAVYGIIFYIYFLISILKGVKKVYKLEWGLFYIIILLTFTNEVIWTAPLILLFLFINKNCLTKNIDKEKIKWLIYRRKKSEGKIM